MSHILVLSPHPDDEATGCGGALRDHVVRGDDVHVIFLTSGEMGGHGLSPDETARRREQEAADAARILGLAPIEFWRLRDGGLRATRSVTARLRAKIDEWQPQTVYVTHEAEMHGDHRAAARLVRQALSGPDAPRGRPPVRLYEVWTPLQHMDAIVDISPYVEIKMAAVRAYRSQCDVMRFDEAFLGLNRYRGEMHSWPGGPYAEVFAEMRL